MRRTVITSQEDQDGESRVFAVQAIYLVMTNTSIKSGITDISHVTYDESHVIHYESENESEIRQTPHVALYESEILDHESEKPRNTTCDCEGR